jgi:hypothetical protein
MFKIEKKNSDKCEELVSPELFDSRVIIRKADLWDPY